MGDNKLIAACLIGIVLVFLIGAFIIVSLIMGTDDNSSTNSSESSVFDNSTPEALAISIARLNERSSFDSVKVVNASMTSDSKYWIVKMNDGMDYSWIVKVDAKTGMSKKNEGRWKSLDELKAIYVADIQSYTRNVDLGEPSKITMGGKEVWKVPVHYFNKSNPELAYIYVDVATGKSRNDFDYDFFNKASKPEDWLTLKRVDSIINKIRNADGDDSKSFKDALRSLYSETLSIFKFIVRSLESRENILTHELK